MFLFVLPSLVNYHLGVLVERWDVAVADAELCPVVVAGAGIKVDVYLAVADGLDELILVEGGELQLIFR